MNKQRARYATLPETLKESFGLRFGDLQLKGPHITLLVDSFIFETGCLKVLLVSDEGASELEMIDLCEEDKLKPALRHKISVMKQNNLIKCSYTFVVFCGVVAAHVHAR